MMDYPGLGASGDDLSLHAVILHDRGAPVKHSTIVPAGVMLVAVIAGACGTDLPSEATPPQVATASAAAYTSVDIGALLGNYSSKANGVNDAGDVAGWSCCGSGSGAFARVAGVVRLLAGDGSAALAISNGAPRYVVGYSGSPSKPVRWTIGNPTQATFLSLLTDERSGAARGVNDAGAAVGNAGARAAMWSAAGTRTSLPAPAGFARGEGRGINNADHAVFVFFVAGSDWNGARAYLRLASGSLVALPPQSGDVASYANDISEVVDGAIYIAGTTRTSQDVFRSVRWKVNVATGVILQTTLRSEMSHALAVGNAGGTAGYLEENVRSLRYIAYLWRGTEFLTLNPPKGGKDGRALAASPNGRFVAGETVVALTPHAVLWTIGSP